MVGTISIIYPLHGVSESDHIKSMSIGGYLQANNVSTHHVPGVAFGWNQSELHKANETMHLLRPLLLDANKWGFEVTLPRFIRDCARWHSGERSKFEGGLRVKDLFSFLD